MQHMSGRSSTPRYPGLRATLAALACATLVSIGGVAVAASPEEAPGAPSDPAAVVYEEPADSVAGQPDASIPDVQTDPVEPIVPVEPEAPADQVSQPSEQPNQSDPINAGGGGVDNSQSPADTETDQDQPLDPNAGQAEKPVASQSLDEADEVAPQVAGPEPGSGRYVYWESRNGTSSSSPLLGGGTFQLQFGGTGTSANWTSNPAVYTVVDCVATDATQCTGYDKDPDAGEIQVLDGATGPQGTVTIQSNTRPHFRVSPAPAPASWQTADGKTWIFTTSAWATGRFSSNSAVALDLGDFAVTQAGLMWDLRNGTTATSPLVGGGTFQLQFGGTGSSANWTSNPTVYRVLDCIATPCVGYDSDPTPGMIQIVSGATDSNGLSPVSFANSQHWRARGSSTVAQWDWNGATWGYIPPTSNSGWLTQRMPTSGAVSRDLGDLRAASAYLTWDVRDQASALVGGASFNVRNNASQGTVYSVPDCAASPCTGYDSDPTPGVFKVANGATDANGANPIAMSNSDRWGYQQGSPTWEYEGALYQFSSPSTSWTTMSGTNLWNTVDGVYWYRFPNVAAKAADQSGTMSVTVRKRALANPSSISGSVSSNIGVDYSYTEGARFRLYTNQAGSPGTAITASWASCEVPAGAGECSFTIPGASGGLQGQQLWVIEEAPRPGSPAANTYVNPLLYVNESTSPGPQVAVRMVGLTSAISNGATDYLPKVANGVTGGTPLASGGANERMASFGAVANSYNNPSVKVSCSKPELKVAIVLDESGSVGPANWTNMRNAVAGTGNNSVMAVLQDKALVSILSFSDTARWRYTTGTPVPVTASNRQAIYDSLNGRSGTYTNWDDGLADIPSGTFDLVLFVTDGAPNRVFSDGTGAGDGSNVTLRALEAPIYEANRLKASGTRIVSVGVGGGASGANTGANLRAVSGEIAGNDYVQGDWDAINDMLTEIVKQATCTVPIEVNKTEVVGGTATEMAGGWKFSAANSGEGTLIGPNPTNGTTVNNGTTKRGVTWDINFADDNHTAELTLTEDVTSKPDFLLTDVACTVAGVEREVTISGSSVTIAGLTPTSGKVLCTFTNTKVLTGALSIEKKFQDVPTGSGNVPFSGTYACGLNDNQVSEGTWTRTGAGTAATITTTSGAQYDKLPVGSVCTVEETAIGGQPLADNSQGLPSSLVWGTPSYSPTDGEVTIAASSTANVVVTNRTEQVPGSVIWNKVDGSTKLAGSEWLLKGPGQPDEGTPVTDCVAQLASSCIGPDQDPLAGQFKLEDLLWGEYELVETKAPSGYQLDTTPHRFEVGKEGVIELNLGNIVNVPVIPPTIPLTGGLGRDAFLIAGASAVLLGAAGVVWAQHRRSRKEVI